MLSSGVDFALQVVSSSLKHPLFPKLQYRSIDNAGKMHITANFALHASDNYLQSQVFGLSSAAKIAVGGVYRYTLEELDELLKTAESCVGGLQDYLAKILEQQNKPVSAFSDGITVHAL